MRLFLAQVASVLLAAFCFAAVAPPLDPASPPKASPAAPTLEQFRERVWCVWQMSSAAALPSGVNAAENHWGMGWGVPQGGYAAFYRDQVKPMIARGFRRFEFHQPYGEDRDGYMDFDARVDASERGFNAPLDFGGMLRRLQREHPDVRVIVYLGAVREPNLKGRLDEGKLLAWEDRYRRSLIDVLDVRIADLAIDNSATLSAESVEWQRIEATFAMLESQGRSGWIEATPFRDHTHHHACNIITSEQTWDNRPVDDAMQPGRPQHAWAAPSQMLTGRIQRWDLKLGRGGDFAGSIAHVLQDGHEWGGSLMYYEGTLQSLWEKVIARMAPPPAVEVEAETAMLIDGPPGAVLTGGTSMYDGTIGRGPRVAWTWPAGTRGQARIVTHAAASDPRQPRRQVRETTQAVGAP